MKSKIFLLFIYLTLFASSCNCWAPRNSVHRRFVSVHHYGYHHNGNHHGNHHSNAHHGPRRSHR